MQNVLSDFRFRKYMLRFSSFVPRFYNLCKSYGFESGRMMPSRAFCSDESQGFPVIIIAKHFGAFPFNHGLVGGIVATDRHGPHAHHGKDLVIIQASHVGYDPNTQEFGVYRRLQTCPPSDTPSCGKIDAVLGWYQKEYEFARKNLFFRVMDGLDVLAIDNQFLDSERDQGLFLDLDRIVDLNAGPVRILSTSKVYRLRSGFQIRPPLGSGEPWTAIGNGLTPDLFYFKRKISKTVEGRDQLERNLARFMPQIVTSEFPALSSAVANTRTEFDRAYRTIVKEPGYQGKNLAFIAGINIDISPGDGQVFPLTKFIPWAAYIQTRQGKQMIFEQRQISEALSSQSSSNPERIELSKAIRIMEETPGIDINFPGDPGVSNLDIS